MKIYIILTQIHPLIRFCVPITTTCTGIMSGRTNRSSSVLSRAALANEHVQKHTKTFFAAAAHDDDADRDGEQEGAGCNQRDRPFRHHCTTCEKRKTKQKTRQEQEKMRDKYLVSCVQFDE